MNWWTPLSGCPPLLLRQYLPGGRDTVQRSFRQCDQLAVRRTFGIWRCTLKRDDDAFVSYGEQHVAAPKCFVADTVDFVVEVVALDELAPQRAVLFGVEHRRDP